MWLISFLLLVLSCRSAVVADVTSNPLEHVMRLNYNIHFSQKSLPRGLKREQYYPMRLSNGSTFVCILPELAYEQTASSTITTTRASMPIAAKSEVPADVVRLMHERFRGVCLTVTEGWWTYRFCWNDGVLQFHIPTAVLSGGVLLITDTLDAQAQFVLGVAPREKAKKQKEKENKDDGFASMSFHYGIEPTGERYIATTYSSGDVCVLTNIPRATEVRLYCAREAAEEEMMFVREAEVCRYVASVVTRRACIPELQEETTKGAITCHEILRKNAKEEEEEVQVRDGTTS